MELYLIRHGEPQWVDDDRCVVDPMLTERGHRQSQAVAEALRGIHFDEIFVSPLQRTSLTAEPMLAERGATAQVVEWLREIAEPDWHGQHATVAVDAYANERRLTAEERWNGIPGGEAPRDFARRVEDGCADYLTSRGWRRTSQPLPVWKVPADEQSTRVAMFAHAGTNGVILCHLLGIAPVPWEWDRLATSHASITKLTTMEMGDGHTWMLDALSNVEHLDRADRTR
ncbi:MAG TPA: histidine phosphatase family protein [Ilumatobacteraceae bacterium]|nr:histidine phosphatase family protein [Ilumatobacteraceae bacterium]